MSNNGPLKLKLNIGALANSQTSANQTPRTSTPTPSASTPGGTKLKLKFGSKSSAPSTPAPADEVPKIKKTKTGRAPKPTAKIIESRKRANEDSEGEEEDGGTIQVQRPHTGPASKKIKLHVNSVTPKTPATKTPITPGGFVLKAKNKGKPPRRPVGEGYDSEASDREIDPTIEEEFILRMMPGDDCDYLRQAIIDKKIGLPKASPYFGADVSMKFHDGDGRRACVNVRGNLYAATVVDLPCVIEGMKSWDKRGWWKSADICQMLWVFSPIKSEEDSKYIPLPSIIDPKTFQYPHGLTPPMHFARKRRFRKRVHKSQIEAVEAEVERLLQLDAQAESSSYMIIDPELEDRRASQAWTPDRSQGDYEAGRDQYSEDEDPDADGDADDDGYFGGQHGQAQLSHNTQANAGVKQEDGWDDANLENDLEAAFNEDLFPDNQSEGQTPMSTTMATPSQLAVSTPAAEPSIGEEDSGDESFESDDGGDDAPAEEDPDEIARRAERENMRAHIAELQQGYDKAKTNLATTTNVLLRRRIEDSMKKMMAEIELKKSSLGEDEDE